MSNIPILYSFRRCPYAMRARIAIKLCNIKVELREVLLKNIPDEMSTISPKSTVPVLLLPNCNVLEESVEIMDWAFKKNDLYNINNTKEKNINSTNSLLKKFDGKFKFHLDRYKYFNRFTNENNIKNPEYHRNKCLEVLSLIEKLLQEKNLWIFKNNPSYLDIAILPFVRQYRIANTEWFDHEMPLLKIKKWLNRFLEWDVFESIMVKNPLWEKNNLPIYFGQD